MRDRLVVILAPDDPWATREDLSLEELRERTLLTREPGSALRAAVDQLFVADPLQSEGVIELGEPEALKRCVEAGLGVALIQAISVEREIAEGKLRLLRLRGQDDSRVYASVQRQGRPLSSAAGNFLGVLREICETDKGL